MARAGGSAECIRHHLISTREAIALWSPPFSWSPKDSLACLLYPLDANQSSLIFAVFIISTFLGASKELFVTDVLHAYYRIVCWPMQNNKQNDC
jgi:hypothetical protein